MSLAADVRKVETAIEKWVSEHPKEARSSFTTREQVIEIATKTAPAVVVAIREGKLRLVFEKEGQPPEFMLPDES